MLTIKKQRCWCPKMDNSLKDEGGLSSEKEVNSLKTMIIKIERYAPNIVIITFETMMYKWTQSPIKCRLVIKLQLILTIKKKPYK